MMTSADTDGGAGDAAPPPRSVIHAEETADPGILPGVQPEDALGILLGRQPEKAPGSLPGGQPESAQRSDGEEDHPDSVHHH